MAGYRLDLQLGAGRTAVVYAARALKNGRPVAVKVSRGPEMDAALARQYAQSAGLAHRNLIGTEALTRTADGRIALVLERVAGVPLDEVPPLATRHRLVVARGIARALAVLHGSGAVHGDLSPNNVLLDAGEPPTPRLVDLGGAAEAGGTPDYMAPEVLRGAAPDRAADLYALGCVLHTVLLGAPPFAERPLDRRTHAHLYEEPTFSDALDPRLAELLAALLAKRPGARPAAAEAVLERLAEIAGDDPAAELAGVGRALLWRDGLAAREDARAAVGAMIAAVAGGRGELVVVGGSRGAGRTTLARHAAAVASARDVVPLVIEAATVEAALAALGRARAGDPVAALADALAGLAEAGPHCVVVDASGGDAVACVALAEALRTAARAAPVGGLLLTDEALPGASALPPLDAAARRAVLAERLAFHDDADGTEAIAALLDAVDVTTPGALVRVLEALSTRGVLVRLPDRWTLDHSRLAADRAALATELAEAFVAVADPAERAALAALSVVSRPVRLGDVAALAGLSSPATRRALEGLAKRGLARRVAGRRWQACRPLDLDAEERRHLHAAAAARADGLYDASVAALERVWHLVHAGAPCPPADVLGAAEAMLGAGAGARALALIEARRPADGDDTVPWSIVRARVRMARGETAAARTALEAALCERDDPRLVLELGALLVRAGDHATARALLEARAQTPDTRLELARARLWTGDAAGALTLASTLRDDADLPPRIRAAACHVVATCTWQRGELEAAEAVARAGLALVGDDAATRADLLRSVGAALFYRSRHDEAAEALGEAVATNRQLGRTPELARSLNNLGLVRYGRGEWPDAERAWAEYRLLCARTGDPVEMCNATNNLGFLTLRLGGARRAAELFRRCVDDAERAGYQRIVPVARANLGEALAAAGETDAGLAALDRAAEELDALTARHDRLEVERRRAELHLARGATATARALLEALLADPRLDEVPAEAAHVRRVLAACLVAAGEAAAATDMARDALARFEAQGSPYEAALGREAVARAELLAGRGREAARVCADARATFERLGARADLERVTRFAADLERREARADRRAQRGDILLDLALRFGSTLELESLLPTVLARVVELLGADRGLFALYDRGGRVERAVVHGLEWDGPGHPLPVSHGLLDDVRGRGEPVLVQDALGDADFGGRRSVRVLGLRTLIGVPVLVQGRVDGVLYVDSRRPVRRVEEELDLLAAVARLVGMAVENARLFEEQRYRSSLLATAVHDFRSPLSVIVSNGELLQMDGMPLDEVVDIGRDLTASGRRMLQMIDGTLELARIDAGVAAPDPAPVDVAALIRGHAAGMRALTAARRLEIAIGPAGAALVPTIEEHLLLVLDNLLFNAVKHAPAGSVIEVSFALRDDAGPQGARVRPRGAAECHFRKLKPVRPAGDCRYLEVGIRNGGAPIPDAVLGRLFKPYARGDQGAGGHKSTGLGLFLVDECVRHLGGCVWATSTREEGTRFAFTLPTAVAAGDASARAPFVRA